MAKDGKDKANVNLDLQAGKHVSEIFNRSQRTNTFDKISSFVKAIREKHQSTEPGEYVGLLLWTNQKKIGDLSDRYGSQSRLSSDIVKQHGENRRKRASFECIVHIPEITGMLWPDFTKLVPALRDPELFQFAQGNAVDEADFERVKAEYPQVLTDAFPEVVKLAMYPKFYFYKSGAGQPAPFNMCKVKFSQASPTKGLGIYLETVSEHGIQK